MTPAAPVRPAASPLAAGPAPVVLPPVVAVAPVVAVPVAGPGQAVAAPAASAAAASAADLVIRWAALPEATRRSLPALSWSGGVYADQPAQRLVVVNGQVVREGDELATGLRLEQIGPKSVVVRWRGQRIELPM
jgi:general secretion pathway protein B